MTKDKEIEQWRSSHKFYTEETIRKLKVEEKLNEKVRYREQLYDWAMNGRIGLKPFYK